MKYNKYDVITMDNNSKYIICDVIYEDNVIYLYLVNDDDDKDIILIKEVDGILEPIKDSNEFERIMLKITVSNKNMINEIID
ncbi:unknown [Clostridium sp. CAG:762]|jgi:hypothetical protein|nr:unknown [Clostridium sp. CAG:762]